MSTIDLFEADMAAMKAGGIKGDEETSEFSREEYVRKIEERKKNILQLAEKIALIKAEMDLSEKEKRLEKMLSDTMLGLKSKSESKAEEVGV
jgi:hypothetical protein